eukprot:gene51747-70509_t
MHQAERAATGDARMIRVGVDVGGTFTDLVLEAVGEDGRQKVYVHKVSSTPKDLSFGVARRGFFKGDLFVAAAVVGCGSLLALFIVFPVLKALSA